MRIVTEARVPAKIGKSRLVNAHAEPNPTPSRVSAFPNTRPSSPSRVWRNVSPNPHAGHWRRGPKPADHSRDAATSHQSRERGGHVAWALADLRYCGRFFCVQHIAESGLLRRKGSVPCMNHLPPLGATMDDVVLAPPRSEKKIFSDISGAQRLYPSLRGSQLASPA